MNLASTRISDAGLTHLEPLADLMEIHLEYLNGDDLKFEDSTDVSPTPIWRMRTDRFLGALRELQTFLRRQLRLAMCRHEFEIGGFFFKGRQRTCEFTHGPCQTDQEEDDS